MADRTVCEHRPELVGRLTEELCRYRSCGEHCLQELAEVGVVLDQRLRVPEPLEEDALGLIVAEVDLVLQRSGVLGADDLHALCRQALELLELAFVELEP